MAKTGEELCLPQWWRSNPWRTRSCRRRPSAVVTRACCRGCCPPLWSSRPAPPLKFPVIAVRFTSSTQPSTRKSVSGQKIIPWSWAVSRQRQRPGSSSTPSALIGNEKFLWLKKHFDKRLSLRGGYGKGRSRRWRVRWWRRPQPWRRPRRWI
jgi:hypothetical protein